MTDEAEREDKEKCDERCKKSEKRLDDVEERVTKIEQFVDMPESNKEQDDVENKTASARTDIDDGDHSAASSD